MNEEMKGSDQKVIRRIEQNTDHKHSAGELLLENKSLYQQNQELRALLKEAECPNKHNESYCVNGRLYYIGSNKRECDWCAKRDALLGEGNDG